MSVTKGECPTCRGSRNAIVVAEHVEKPGGEDIPDRHTWRILSCAGCSTTFVQVVSEYETVEGQGIGYSSTAHWPKFSDVKKPQLQFADITVREESDGSISLQTETKTLPRLVHDFHVCLENDLRVPAAVAARTVVEGAAIELGIDAHGFANTLKRLAADGWISKSEQEKLLKPLVDAGSAAVHRGWMPTQSQINTIAKILYGFIERVFIHIGEADGLVKAVPKRKENFGQK